MMTLREILEQLEGRGITVTDWEEAEEYARKHLSAFLDDTLVMNAGEVEKPAEEARKLCANT